MPTLPGSAVGSRLPSTYRPPGTSTIAPSNGIPGYSGRQLANRINESRAAQGSYSPPRATGTYRAAAARPPATYTRGGIPLNSYSRPDPFVRMPTYGGKYDPVLFNGPNPRQLPRPAINPRPAQLPRAAGRVPRAIGGMSRGGGAALAGVGGAIAAGSVLASGGSAAEAVGAGVGTAVGSVAGATVGATVGAALGPAGAAVGAVVGSAVGGYVGGAVGQAIGDYVDGEDIPSEAIAPSGVGEELTASDYLNSQDPSSEFDFRGFGGVRVAYEEFLGAPGTRQHNIESWGGMFSTPRLFYEDTQRIWYVLYTRCGQSQQQSSVGFRGIDEGPPEINLRIIETGVCGEPQPELLPSQPPPRATLFNGAPPGIIEAPKDLPNPQREPNKIPLPTKGSPSPTPQTVPAPAPGTETAPAATPENTPAPAPAPTGYQQAAGPNTATIPTYGTPESDQQADRDPYQREVVNQQMATGEDLGQAIAGSEELGTTNLEGTEQDPTPELEPELETQLQPGTGLGLLPIPAAMPVNKNKPQGMPKGAVKLRPTGTSGQGTKGPAPPAKQYPTSTAGNCGCNVPMIKNQQAILSQIGGTGQTADPNNSDILARLTRIEANQKNPVFGFAALQTGQAGILGFLTTMNNFIKLAWEKTRVQKVLDVLTFIGVMHNVALLSRDVGETFGWVAGQALNAVGIEDEEGNTIDVYGWFTGSLQSLLVTMFGQELYDDARDTWLKASSIVRSASMIIWTMRGIMDATQDLMEWIAENTGRIGNALKRFGVVGERAYPWMSERAQARNRIRSRFDKVTGTLENAEDKASSFAMATGNVLEIQDETAELGNQFVDFRSTVLDSIPDPWADNTPVQTDFAEENAASQSPDIEGSDTTRG